MHQISIRNRNPGSEIRDIRGLDIYFGDDLICQVGNFTEFREWPTSNEKPRMERSAEPSPVPVVLCDEAREFLEFAASRKPQ
jgi:hypothetical protein